MAANTPPTRNRVVDFMRVASILVVVFGHWLMAAIRIEDGELIPGHLLELADWTHPLTWIFQVMPVFFFVGGYSNALSLRSARRRHELYGSWLRARLRRLTIPVVALLVVWTVGGWIALKLGAAWELLQTASQVAVVPTWFLAAYVVIVGLAPLALTLWERWGWKTVLVGVVLAALADILSMGQGIVPIGFANYIFVWATVHQLGYAWLDGGFADRWKRYLLAFGGLGATLLLVWLGPYPVAMVGLDTADVTNSYPPRVTLAFLGMFQAGLVLIAEPLLERLLQRRGPWTFVVGISSQIMTLYLWHLTAMVTVIGLGMALGGFGFGVDPLSGMWWLSRPIWFLVLGMMTLVFILIFAKFERPGTDKRPAPPWWRPVVGLLMVCAGLGLLAAIGIADADGLNGIFLSLPLVGVVFGGILQLPARLRPSGPPAD